jgi:hypothetical protein
MNGFVVFEVESDADAFHSLIKEDERFFRGSIMPKVFTFEKLTEEEFHQLGLTVGEKGDITESAQYGPF